MADFGGLQCDMIKGNSLGLTNMVEVWHMPGVDGYGAHDLGKADSQVSFTLIFHGNLASCEDWYGFIMERKGTVITIIDDFGVTHPLCLILGMSQARRTVAHHLGGYRYEVEVMGVVV